MTSQENSSPCIYFINLNVKRMCLQDCLKFIFHTSSLLEFFVIASGNMMTSGIYKYTPDLIIIYFNYFAK